MISLFAKLRSTVPKTYGWDVELPCKKCGLVTPRYEGRTSSLTTNIPNATIYAKLACPVCGRRFVNEAAGKLVDLFGNIDIPAPNKKIISSFIIRLMLIPAVLAFVLFFGMQMDWWTWGLGSVWILIVSAIAVPLLIFHKNSQIAKLTSSCDCGKAYYIYMGSFEDTQCFRCFSCGRLMKLRE